MSTSFPGALDALTNPAATDGLTGHAAQHANANDAIEALEAKVGVDNSTDPASLDYRVATLESGGGGGIWGSITGALSDQTDLQAALNGKLSASATTDAIAEGSSNLYFTAARVRDAVLTGLSTATNAVIAATDSVLTAFGKLQAQISGHTSSTANPHSVTKTQVGLGNVDNTADLNKPVSTATQAALALKADLVSPAFTTPDIGVATGTSFNSITGLSSTTPVMDGTAAVGTGVTVARADHVHPTDTSRAPIASPSFTGTLTHSGDVVLSGSGKRITGDFSNATSANRTVFKSNVTNGSTFVGAIPDGTTQYASFDAYNSSDPDNAGYLRCVATPTDMSIRSNKNGTGSYLPLTFYAGGSERMRIDTSGNVLVNSPACLGYGPGAGGTVTQATSKSTAVTLNKACGFVTMHNSPLGGGGSVSFIMNNNVLVNNDVVIITPYYGGVSPIPYRIECKFATSQQINITVTNLSAVSLSDALEFKFAIIRGALP